MSNYNNGFNLLECINKNEPVMIQAHDFPDHDALAAAFGLWTFFEQMGIEGYITYGGTIANTSLPDMIRLCKIPATHLSKMQMTETQQVIVVDGFPGNNNISSIPGNIIGVIDHHHPPEFNEDDYLFLDIRSEYGSCSAIVYEYLYENRVEIERDLATAMLMAILIDTNYLTRGVHESDLRCLSAIYHMADVDGGTSVLRNSLSIRDLDTFRYAIDSCEYVGDICIIHLDEECSPEISGLLGDFFLRVREVEFVIQLITVSDGWRISVRSEDPKRSAAVVTTRALDGIGSGGGHVYMAGGRAEKNVSIDRIKQRFLEALKK